MLAIRKDLGLQRKKRAAGVDEINARQPVLQRDLLRAQMFLHRHREIRSAFDGGVVSDDQAFTLLHASDAGDQTRAGRFVVVHSIGRERRELEKRRVAIEQRRDALAHRQFPLLFVALQVLRAAALPRLRDPAFELVNERLHALAIRAELCAGRIKMAFEWLHVSPTSS